MRRLTTDNADCMMSYLNMFYSDGGKVFIRGSGCAPDFQDVPLVDWIRSASSKQGLRFTADDPEHLYEEIHDVLDEGYETVEGIIALLYRAAIQAAEMRRVLKSIEDILGGTYYDLDHLRDLVQADRDGRCEALPCKKWVHLGGDEWCCSSCGNVIHTEGSWEKPGKKYCEECGAKMDLEE